MAALGNHKGRPYERRWGREGICSALGNHEGVRLRTENLQADVPRAIDGRMNREVVARIPGGNGAAPRVPASPGAGG